MTVSGVDNISIEGNEILLGWAIENVIRNGIDSIQSEKGKVDISISSDDVSGIIQIQDNGAGIMKKDWKNIFRPGFSTKERGWGLGLSLVNRIINEIHKLINDGHKEVILTGVDIASWGNDINDELSLSTLVRKILTQIPELERLRLSSMDVIGFDESLINLIAENQKIMPHIHLSLQSGDNMILKRMKRRHSREDAIYLCEKLKLSRPEITFGADLIVGFPTETDEMFQNTLKIVDDCDLDWIHAFPFSPRPGTPAARMTKIEHHIIKERSKTLREAALKRKEIHLSNLIGSKVKVFMEKQNRGHTNQFAPVKFIEEEIKHGQTVDALIVDADKECAYALAV